MSKEVQIFLIDNHPIVLQGLQHFFNSKTDMFVCGMTAEVIDVEAMIKQCSPDIVIIDIYLYNDFELELITQITQVLKLPVLVFSRYKDSIYAARALEAGANGYLSKQENEHKLVIAVKKIMKNQIYLSEEICTSVLNQWRGHTTSQSLIQKLSKREFQVFEFLGQGKNSREIGEILHLSSSTVETYKSKIKEKLNIPNSRELICYAVKWITQYLK